MKRDVSIIALCDMIFILLLALAGSLSGEIGRVAYYLSYLIPIFALLILYRDKREKLLVMPKKDSLSFVLAAFAPFLSVIILISYLSSLLLGLFGVTNEVDVSGNVFYEILRHALLPSILEELLFRLLPISILARHSRKNAVLISSLLFAFAHCNLFQIPYAFVAGIALGALTIISGSIIPSFLFHFANNLLSVILLKFGTGNWVLAFYLVLGVLCLISVAAFVLLRRGLVRKIKEALCGEEGFEITGGTAIFVAMAALIAIINFLSLL